MKNWEYKKLGDVCDVKCGATPLKSDKSFWENGNIPWFTVDDIRHQGRIITTTQKTVTDKALNKLTLFPKDTILLCCTASVGEYAITTIPLTCNQQFNGLIIKNKENLYPKYLYHFSSTLKERLLSVSGKTTIDFVSNSKVCNIEIPLPPLEEQKRIVKILDEKFAMLETVKANAKANLQNAKDLFQSQLSKAFFNTTWEKKRLDEICLIRPSKADTTRNLKDSDEVSFLPMEDLQVMNYYIEPKQSKILKEVSGSYTCFANGDVLLAKVTPCFENGKQGIAKDLDNGVGFGSSEYIVFRPLEKVISEYIYYSLATPEFKEGGKKNLLGACGLKRLSKDYVNAYEIPLPPLSEQKRIVEQLDSLSEKVRSLEEIYTKQLANCDELKQAFLAKAFNGEL